jgi:tetratricopeptide (TPR) repeat protein
MRSSAILFVPICLALAGCSRFDTVPGGNYQTIQADLGRDTAKAKELNQRAIECVDAGNSQQALELLQEALIADVMFGPAHNNLGKLYLDQRQYYLAAWEFEYAMKLMPERAAPANNLGLLYESLGRHGEAVALYESAVSLDPDDAQYLGNLVRAKIRRGDEHDENLQQHLRRLQVLETRPEWAAWAADLANLSGPTEELPDEEAGSLPESQGGKRASPPRKPEILPTPSPSRSESMSSDGSAYDDAVPRIRRLPDLGISPPDNTRRGATPGQD